MVGVDLARVGKRVGLVRRVEVGIEESHQSPPLTEAADKRVEVLHNLLAGSVNLHCGHEAALDHRHQQPRAHAVPRDVTEHQT